MPLGPNFSLNVEVQGNKLIVHGKTDPYPDRGELIGRHIALEQHGNAIHGNASVAYGDWQCELTRPADGSFQECTTASACGIEIVYYGAPGPIGRPPAFVALTWAQQVTIGDPPTEPDDAAEPR